MESGLGWRRCLDLLEKEDEQWDWLDYREFFSEFEPLGTYRESVYFFPYAFSYILTHPENAHEVAEPALIFASEHVAELKASGDLEAVRTGIREFLNAWTSRFDATPQEEDVYVGGVLVEGCFDHIRRGGVLNEALSCLIHRAVHRDLAEDFVRSLAETLEDPAKASWFLELAWREGERGSQLPDQGLTIELLRDKETRIAAADTVQKKLKELGKESWYWEECIYWMCLVD